MLRLTYERIQHGWSKAHLARRARLDQALVSKFESNRARPSPRELRRLAAAPGLSATEAGRLLEEVDAGTGPDGGPGNPEHPTLRHDEASSADARVVAAKTNP